MRKLFQFLTKIIYDRRRDDTFGTTAVHGKSHPPKINGTVDLGTIQFVNELLLLLFILERSSALGSFEYILLLAFRVQNELFANLEQIVEHLLLLVEIQLLFDYIFDINQLQLVDWIIYLKRFQDILEKSHVRVVFIKLDN